MPLIWPDSLKNASTIKANNKIPVYNNAVGNIPAYYIPANTSANVTFDEFKNALLVTNCTKSEVIGKYIINIVDTGNENLIVTNESVTTEATQGTENDELDTDTVISIDESFLETVVYKEYKSEQEYRNDLETGLRIIDLRGIFGMPHQFLPITDPRIDSGSGSGDNDSLGRVYSEKIIKHIPLLLMTPGTPTFMSSFSQDQKQKIIGMLGDLFKGNFDEIFSDGITGKYYTLKYNYTEYFYYVNAMLRSAACFLEIQDETIDNKKLGTFNWLYASLDGNEIYSNNNLNAFLGPYAGSIPFYADAGTTVDDSFNNSTTESQLTSALNNISDSGRELNFLLGTVGSNAGVGLDELSKNAQNSIDDLSSNIDRILGSSNILSNILNKGGDLLAGGRIVFPEIWSDSSFSRSYSCSMKLVSPSGDKLSVFLNILVPIYHLLGFVLPRQGDSNQTYMSPFLVRAYYKGLFNVDMGIITNLSITKGDEGEWTADGIPTVANISFDIKDLYDGLYMSKQTFDKDTNIMSNITELDYIANSCGINVNDQEVMRTVKLSAALGFSEIVDKITIGIFGNIHQYFNQKIQNIFGVF